MAKFRVRNEAGQVVEIDPASKKSVKALSAKVGTLAEQVAELMYVPIAIKSFTVSPDAVEIGSTVSSVKLAWTLNKTPLELYINQEEIEPAISGSVQIPNPEIKENTTWEIEASDERGTAVLKKASITFKRAVYYGVGAARESYDDTFFGTLKSEWRTNKKPSITVSPNQQHVYYCLPVSFGKCSFSLGVLPGGFELAATVSHTNVHGATEQYYVYRSVELLNMTDMVWNIT